MSYRKPKRAFECRGSVNPDVSYYVPLDNVVNWDRQNIETMVDRGRYFSIFAPRQSGKTTLLRQTCETLHSDPDYAVIMLSFEDYAGLDKAGFYADIENDLYGQLLDRLKAVDCPDIDAVSKFLETHHLTDHLSFCDLFEDLNPIIPSKKIVVFIDEFDGIPPSQPPSFLSTIRYLFEEYKREDQKALYSFGIVGLRNIAQLVEGGVSPFNIAHQVDLPPFSLKNIRDLYAQYTRETNQPFTEAAVQKIHRETGGQPWLVNRLAVILTVNVKPGTVEPIDEADVDEALRLLLAAENAHFDNLFDKAKRHKETFFKIVFTDVGYSLYCPEQSWLEQYGLIRKQDTKEKKIKAVVANNIYKARFVETFSLAAIGSHPIILNDYVLPGRRLDMNRILMAFDMFFTEIGADVFNRGKMPYEETIQFLLTAWLYQFAVGGDDQLHFQLRSGLGRLDILLDYKGKKYIIETKVNRYNDISMVRDEGLQQLTDKYLAAEAVKEGYLVIFDTKTSVGTLTKPATHKSKGKTVICYQINIGKR